MVTVDAIEANHDAAPTLRAATKNPIARNVGATKVPVPRSVSRTGRPTIASITAWGV